MTSRLALPQFSSAVRWKGALAICLALCTLALGVSASANHDGNERKAKIIIFDAPGSGTDPGQGTLGIAINPAGAIAGAYTDAGGVNHGFLRAPDGDITTFDVPGAGTGPGQGTFVAGVGAITPAGAIVGEYTDQNGVNHGFLRAPDGTITTIDVSDAGTGAGQGTSAEDVNAEGAIAGEYSDASSVFHGFVRAEDGTITTFDVLGAGTGPGQGTFVASVEGLTPAGAQAGFYTDQSGVNHGYVRAPDGTITTFDVPGAGTGPGQGNFVGGINPEGTVMSTYLDLNNAFHGYVRAPDGTITTFDILGAGTGPGQGTVPFDNNPADAITGWEIDANGVYHGFLRTP